MENQCKAITRKGERCKREAIIGDYCNRHFQIIREKLKKKNQIKKTARVTESLEECYKCWLKSKKV